MALTDLLPKGGMVEANLLLSVTCWPKVLAPGNVMKVC
jgi:hypothetical protein